MSHLTLEASQMKILPHCSYSLCLCLAFLWHDSLVAHRAFGTELSIKEKCTMLTIGMWSVSPCIILSTVNCILVIQSDVFSLHILVAHVASKTRVVEQEISHCKVLVRWKRYGACRAGTRAGEGLQGLGFY